jgi:HAD superfamily hydrolase (TIGR01458 family)
VAPRGALLDLDGVLYEGERSVPGADAAIEWLSERAVPHLFLTNTTSRPRSALVEKLGGLGLRVEADELLTPPIAADRWLAKHAPGPAALFVPPATVGDFHSVPHLPGDAERGASSVVIGDLGEGFCFRVLNRAFRLLMQQPPPVFVALGMTRYWRAEDGLRLDVAPFVVGLEHASGADAVVLGKPSPRFYESALERIGCAAKDAVMIGDDIVGDVGGAQGAGLRGILVRTGKFRGSDLQGGIRPDAVLDSIADLPSWWEGAA